MTNYANDLQSLFINTEKTQYNSVNKNSKDFDCVNIKRSAPRASAHKTVNTNKKASSSSSGNSLTTSEELLIVGSVLGKKAIKNFEESKKEAAIAIKELKSRPKQNQVKFVTKKASTRTKLPLAFAAYVIAFSAIFIMLAYNFSSISEITTEISNLEAQISECNKEQQRINVLINNKDDLKFIENEAINRLGMVKTDSIATHYVSVGREDKVEVSNTKKDEFSVGVLLSGAAELLEALSGN